MIDFKPVRPEDKELYQSYLLNGSDRSCEYSFVNLYLWGRQNAAIIHDHMVLFSQFNRQSVYPYPVGDGDKKPVLDAIIADAKERGIPCRITSLSDDEKATLETLYPGMFRFHSDRDGYDYVYDINDLADLPGKKYQKKRSKRIGRALKAHTVKLEYAVIVKILDQKRSDPHALHHHHSRRGNAKQKASLSAVRKTARSPTRTAQVNGCRDRHSENK